MNRKVPEGCSESKNAGWKSNRVADDLHPDGGRRLMRRPLRRRAPRLRCRRAPQLRNRRSVVPAPASRACTVPRPSSSRPTFRRRAFSTGERGPRRRRARSGLPPGPHGSDQRPAPSAECCSSATRRYGQLSPTPQTPQGPNARGRHRTHEVAIDRKPGHELLVAAVRFSGDSGGGPATLQRRRSGAAQLNGPPTWSGETPRLGGVLHEFAFFAALAAGIVLVALVSDARAQVASCLYAATLAAMFGASALYHRVRWSSASVRVWIRWLDRSAIFLFIAGTYTPFALLAFHGALATTLLALVWVGAAAGLLLNLAWVDAPTWLAALVYLALGWVGVVALPKLFSSVGLAVSVLVLVGGGLYT